MREGERVPPVWPFPLTCVLNPHIAPHIRGILLLFKPMKGLIFTKNAVYSFVLPKWIVLIVRLFVVRVVPYPECLLTKYRFSQDVKND